MQNVRALLALPPICSLCACSEAPGPSRPWQPYGTNKRTGEREWFSPNYLTRSDCLFGVKELVEQSVHSQWYRAPYGCMYYGYQNPYVQYLVNWYFARDYFRCIARWVTPEAEKSGTLYSPILKSYPRDRSDVWYCYI
jgi:hypothetical protein